MERVIFSNKEITNILKECFSGLVNQFKIQNTNGTSIRHAGISFYSEVLKPQLFTLKNYITVANANYRC